MSFVPTSGNHILVDPPSNKAPRKTQAPGQGLVSWLVAKADPWERNRDDGYRDRWSQYWRLWRGQWINEDRNRSSERSRLIAPALSQAIEMATAEVDEALFSKDVWFDVADDLQDQDKADAQLARDNLIEDLAKVNAQDAVSEAVLNSAIFGTGIMKINVEVVKTAAPRRDAVTKELKAQTEDEVRVTWESIRPDEFIPDPSGRNIGEMLGCFHKVRKPLHTVLEKIEAGTYRKDALQWLGKGQYQGGMSTEVDFTDPQANLGPDEGDEVEILEYHGKVPAALLFATTVERVSRDEKGNVRVSVADSPLDDILMDDDGSMVEAIVTIANDSTLLRAMINPFTMTDRSIVAFQFEKVPGRFWGRGIAEKGFNPQKALDAELRARQDALGYISSPMIGVDGGRVPRGFKLEVKPGKVWLTQGPPSEVLQPITIGELNANTFNQASEMERMVQMGTGAFDTASALRGPDQNGPQAASMIMGAFVKRSKRAIRNVNDNFVQPLLKQTMWRYMQFAPRRYPRDFDFRIMAILGIVAREVEAMQLTQLMGMMPEQYPQVTAAVAKGIIDLSALHNKTEVIDAINQATAPPSPEEQEKQQQLEQMQFLSISAEAEGKVLDNRKKIAETRKLIAEALEAQANAGATSQEAIVEMERLKLELEELDVAREENKIKLATAIVGFKTAQVNATAAQAKAKQAAKPKPASTK